MLGGWTPTSSCTSSRRSAGCIWACSCCSSLGVFAIIALGRAHRGGPMELGLQAGPRHRDSLCSVHRSRSTSSHRGTGTSTLLCPSSCAIWRRWQPSSPCGRGIKGSGLHLLRRPDPHHPGDHHSVARRRLPRPEILRVLGTAPARRVVSLLPHLGSRAAADLALLLVHRRSNRHVGRLRLWVQHRRGHELRLPEPQAVQCVPARCARAVALVRVRRDRHRVLRLDADHDPSLGAGGQADPGGRSDRVFALSGRGH